MARSPRLMVCLDSETRNSSKTQTIRATRRQRTTSWIAGIGPASTTWRRLPRCVVEERAVSRGALPFNNPAAPSWLNRTTQSRTVCSPTPPTAAASDRDPPPLNGRQGDETPGLVRITGVAGKAPQPSGIAVGTERNGSGHGEPSKLTATLNHDLPAPETYRGSASTGLGISF